MSIKQSTLAAAVTAALAMGAAGQAAANVYGLSSLSISDLDIVFTDAGGGPIGIAGPGITSFNFQLQNTANLNGSPASTAAFCNTLIPGPAACGLGTPTLYAGPANAPGGSPRAMEIPNAAVGTGTYSLQGPGALQYASSDSVIRKAEVTGSPTTEAHQIAESELQTGGFATSNAEIKSTTSLFFTFTIADPGPFGMLLTFKADPDLLAKIGVSDLFGSSALASLNVSFSLSQQFGGTGSANWNPQGTLNNDCSVSGGVTCVEIADAEDLNINVQTGTPGIDDPYSNEAAGNFGSYGIRIGNLGAGTWTLGLNAVTSNLIQQPVRVPEPGMLALLGIGLAGLGLVARRRKSV